MGLSGLSGLSALYGGYAEKVVSIQRANLLAYWKLSEPAGTTVVDASANGRNGTYTGVDLGQTGIGDGGTAPLFDGTSDYANVYSTGLRDALNTSELTIALWLKVSGSGVWSDATTRYLVEVSADSNNRISLLRSATNGVLVCAYRAGGTLKQVLTSAQSSTGYLHLALTVSKSADQVKGYLNGAQFSTTQTGLGTWAGLPATALLGALTTAPLNVWSGTLAHVALWSTPLSSVDVARLAIL